MFTIDLTLKTNSASVSVKCKTDEIAEALYQKILTAIRSGSSEILELTCDKEIGKKVAILSDQISTVQISQKSGSSASGKPPGFFAAE